MADLQTSPDLEGVDVAELIEAINDPAKAQALMDAHGWTQDDLLARAEAVSKQLTAAISNVNVV
ncbi:hypothetical protein ACFVHS_42325 [Streptomyces sp. NPDC057746]|uniref:hypothetical protein n=1 Tax=Streptomyces sp. NPDC057746 TaxID=3346237 RepID=UPI003699D3F1